ncbi:Ig-like domain-containing protein [Bacillus sp. ISL-7]|uniref:Ig-like domain-containing protein n=1 Tax=Bacillus sp. ISL-7 TaxID=2819136 RepID=UPI001BE5B1BF|nr:Ig-like domain-containing protein [Bacillus sp. ISL-7]MBT2733623.1 Ig domain-containing protein [Bacillus sp. ISL-7]
MNKKVLIKVFFMMMLLLSVSVGSSVLAASNSSLSNGTYTVGEEISAGLKEFHISEGAATIRISRGTEIYLNESLDSDKYYYSDRFTASLKDGDEIEVEVDYGASNIEVQPISSVDLNHMSIGFYEVGADIPAGTYTLEINDSEVYNDFAYVNIYDPQYNEIGYLSLYADDDPIEYTVSSGDKIYISRMTGTMSLKEKILVPQSITLNKSSLSLLVNRTAQLTATVKPSTAVNKMVSWTSSHPDIATVDMRGNVKALKAGSTSITASANGDPTIKKSINVTVTKVVPTSLKLSRSSLNITNNQMVKVYGTIAPTDAENKTILWKSSNTKVATVDAAGNIKGIANGSATITATASDNVKVFKTVAVRVSTKTVKVNKTSLSVTVGKTAVLSATVSPSDSTDKTVKWKTSNKKIVTVDSKGKIYAIAKGTAIITATVNGAKIVKVQVKVTPPVLAKSVKLNKTFVTLIKGKTITLSATVSPSNVTNKTVKWKSSNTKVAKVDSKGKVTAVGAGTATITSTTTNGKKTSATIRVPYIKSLSAGTWKAGKDLPAGRYKITTSSGSGNLFIGSGTNHFVNEILSSSNDGFGVTVVTTDIKAGDSIQILGLNSVQFTRVSNVKSNILHSGYWTVGKDISAGKYRITTSSGAGNLIIYRGNNLLVNEILSSKADYYEVTSVTVTLKSGDRIQISGLDRVVFSRK